MEIDKNLEKLSIIKDSEVNRALGVFIVFFGIVIIIATVFTETFIGEMTNLIAGLTLLLIGLGMVVKAKYNIKKINSTD